MEEIVRDYLWFEYEGGIMLDMWNKYIRCKFEHDKQKFLVNKFFRHEDVKEFYMWNKYIRWKFEQDKQKFLVNKFFRHEDVKEFYKLSMAIFNLSNILEEPWVYNEMLIERYKQNKDQCEEHNIDISNIEYILWRFESGLVSFRLFLEILDK